MSETGQTYQDTRGNNVYAQENWSGGTSWQNNYRPSGGSALDFDFPINFNTEPEEYVDASTSNLFFWNNIIHDCFWHYGFNEVSGNFQENNLGRGGLGNDAVQANCQDGSGYNNANFATPPDGQRPRMRMYIWSRTVPYRDGDLDSGIIIHEYGHGISIRLTGGPQNVNCLTGGEAGGMGEGWGDWWATALRQRNDYTEDDHFAMGGYDTNTANGIRKFVYTTDMSVNPETYSYITRSGYEGVHAKGEVWCGILWECYWNFVKAYGFTDSWYPLPGNKGDHKGNIRILKDVVDGLKLQPCRPTFVDARDAIIAAHRAHYGNDDGVCLLWRGFAKRGLGINAVAGGVESFTLPPECR
jgi:extracellular elastinolytic metalloproteinase